MIKNLSRSFYHFIILSFYRDPEDPPPPKLPPQNQPKLDPHHHREPPLPPNRIPFPPPVAFPANATNIQNKRNI